MPGGFLLPSHVFRDLKFLECAVGNVAAVPSKHILKSPQGIWLNSRVPSCVRCLLCAAPDDRAGVDKHIQSAKPTLRDTDCKNGESGVHHITQSVRRPPVLP